MSSEEFFDRLHPFMEPVAQDVANPAMTFTQARAERFGTALAANVSIRF